MKRFNNVSSVCTPNTVVCWEVWGYRSWVGEGTGGQNLYSFNFKPPAFYFVNCSNKELLQKAC